MEAQFNITTMKKAGVSILKPKHNYKYFEKLSYFCRLIGPKAMNGIPNEIKFSFVK